MISLKDIPQLRFKDLFESIPELICLHREDGSYLYVNQASIDLIGYEPQELIDTSPYDYFHPDDHQEIRETSHEPLVKGETGLKAVYRFKHKEGHYIWLSTLSHRLEITTPDGEFILLTISRDVSDEYRNFEEIRDTRTMWQEAARMIKIGSWELDVRNMMPRWSKEVFEIHEIDNIKEQPSLEEAGKFYPGEGRKRIFTLLTRCINDAVPFDIKLPFITAKGNHLWVRSVGRPEIVDGKVTKVYGVFQDITHQVQREDQLKELVDEVSHQNHRLEEFHQIVSHNLRSPVGNLKVLIDLLETASNERDRNETLQVLRRLADSFQETLDDLVDVIKIRETQKPKSVKLDLQEVWEKVLARLNATLGKKKADIQIDFSGLRSIKYPPLYLESILHNFLSNSLKYSSPERALSIKVRSYEDGGLQILEFSDNGIGIDMEKFGEKIFKLHQTFHRNPDAKGVGLFMTKNQIEAMGGEIKVQSEPGKGTIFTVVFNKNILPGD
ncbi:MAG: PAS domain-containing sensor histidine kinase [Bacteroidota bacterium]|nr:PAS domain-containing sensor histidine kinase [Bacteroidota bacterium]MDX5506366.1 PAS domain-containing sensor histidine kinase [Bacteroidota bacterium]